MIAIIQKDTQEPALRQLAVRLMNQGVRIGRTPGRDSDVLTLVGDTWRLDPEGLAALPYVLDAGYNYKIGQEIPVMENATARFGHCVICGTKENIRERVDDFYRRLSVKSQSGEEMICRFYP